MILELKIFRIILILIFLDFNAIDSKYFYFIMILIYIFFLSLMTYNIDKFQKKYFKKKFKWGLRIGIQNIK